MCFNTFHYMKEEFKKAMGIDFPILEMVIRIQNLHLILESCVYFWN